MKRIFLFLLILALPVAALAQSAQIENSKTLTLIPMVSAQIENSKTLTLIPMVSGQMNLSKFLTLVPLIHTSTPPPRARAFILGN